MLKIGRNDQCPCGSGKKFKNCHLGREDELFFGNRGEISQELSARITGLPEVSYGRSRDMIDSLDIRDLTGSEMGIRCVDLKKYNSLEFLGQKPPSSGDSGGLLINVLKTRKSDPNNLYLAISPKIQDSTLVHQFAHVIDYLGGSKLMPGSSKALAFDLGIPVEHLEHPHEFAYWLGYLAEKFDVQLDADDTIIFYLYKNEMLIKGEEITRQDRLTLKSKSDKILRFLSEHSPELEALICELPGYIGPRSKKD